MRGKKSPMIMGLIGAMLLSTNAFAAVPSDFSDFPTDWSASAMTHAVQNGLLNGSDGKILPKGLLTRAQMATMVNRAFASSAKASLTSFTDMVPGVWHYDEMAKSVQMGVFQGADGKLSPDDPITREQAFAVLARAFGLADGSAAALNKFSDGTQVSSWARGAVAALVEQGYVSGADGALNPQSYITRAEFAQVMDALVAAYGDQNLKDQTVEGNLILRTNSTLENVTVQGDLILADGVSAASLKNVTVTGRLVVRGGTDGVSLTKSTPKKGIQLANPNGTPKVTVDGKAYVPTGLPGGGSNSGGSSSGGSPGGSSSSSGGGSGVTKTDLVVTAQTKLVDLGWSQYVAVRFTSGNDLNNCTLTVDGTVVNKACSNVTTDGSIVKWEATTWNPAKLVITKGSQSQTVTLSKNANPSKPTVGTVADTYYFLANGPVYVWDYHLTNRDAAGKVRVAPETTQFSLTNKEQDAIKFYSPDAILKQDETASNPYRVSGTVELMFNYAKGTDAEKDWVKGITDVDLVAANENNSTLNDDLNYELIKEYPHGENSTVACITVPLGQRNFYSNGRYQLRVTSNGKSKLFPIHVVNETKPSMTLTDTTAKSGQNVHFRVENMTYGITQPIYRVDLTDPKGKTETLTKIDDWYLIGDTFILYNDTTNHIPTAEKYKLTIYADGFKTFTKEFKVTSGQSLQIQKAALPYGVDTYSGSSLSGGGASSGSGAEGGSNTMNAYIVFKADLLVNAEIMTNLKTGNEYAEAIVNRWNELPTKISVYAEDSSATYDAYSFFDTLNNSQNPMTFTAYVTSDQAVKYTRGTPYAVKQVLEDNLLGETTAFSETANKAAPDITLVKLVDGKDDEYVAATEVTEGQNAMFQCLDKAYLAKLAENGSIYKGTASHQPFASTDYSVDTEKGILTIFKEKLTLGDNSITIKVDGYQTVKLSVRYQKVLEEVSLTGPTEGVQLGDPVTITCNAKNHKDGVCDFFANVTSVELTGPDGKTKTVLPNGQENTSKDTGYLASNNAFTLGKNLFEDKWSENPVGDYTLTINAGYDYAPQTVKFKIKAKEVVPPAGDVVAPSVEKGTYFKAQFMTPAYWQVFFKDISNDDLETYLKAVTSVTVNDYTYEKKSYSSSSKYFELAKNEGLGTGYIYLNLTADGFTADGNTTVVVTATGYEELSFTLDATGKVVTGDDSGATDPVDPSKPEATAAPTVNGVSEVTEFGGSRYYRVSFKGMDKDALKAYLTKINLVTVGSTKYTQSSSSSTNAYKLFATDTTYDASAYDCLDLTPNGFPADVATRVTIEAKGYATLTFDVKNGQLVTDSNAGGSESGGNTSGGTEENPGTSGVTVPTEKPAIEKDSSGYHILTFKGSEAWVGQITGIKVGSDLYKEETSVYNLQSGRFVKDATHGIVYIQFPSNTSGNSAVDYNVVIAAGLNVDNLKLKVTIPSGFFGTPTVEIVND